LITVLAKAAVDLFHPITFEDLGLLIDPALLIRFHNQSAELPDTSNNGTFHINVLLVGPVFNKPIKLPRDWGRFPHPN
jgi:hypothetical protein